MKGLFSYRPQAECAPSKKEIEADQYTKEEKEFIDEQKSKLIQFLKDSSEHSKEDRVRRNELLEKYKKDSAKQKARGSIAQREQMRTRGDIVKETGSYSIRFLFLRVPPGDEVLYHYKRKLQKEIQWRLLTNQTPPVLFGAFLFYLTRRLKQKAATDALYFICGYMFVNYGLFVEQQHKLFEIGYPAHPYIFDKRTHVLNTICYYHPQILKNEIEYLHRKLSKVTEPVADGIEIPSTRYEKEFTLRGGKRFRLIVDQGQVYLRCIDNFEDIFEISRDVIGKDLELTDILEPNMFDSHKEVVNALFEVYHELGTEYCQKHYFQKLSTKLRDDATQRVRQKYGLESGEQEAKELLKSFKQ